MLAHLKIFHFTLQKCNGVPNCQYNRSDYFKDYGLFDLSDEDSLLCNNCTNGTNLRLCADQRTCVHKDLTCDGEEHCYDLSDELAENCDLCQGEGIFSCVYDGLERQENFFIIIITNFAPGAIQHG